MSPGATRNTLIILLQMENKSLIQHQQQNMEKSQETVQNWSTEKLGLSKWRDGVQNTAARGLPGNITNLRRKI